MSPKTRPPPAPPAPARTDARAVLLSFLAPATTALLDSPGAPVKARTNQLGHWERPTRPVHVHGVHAAPTRGRPHYFSLNGAPDGNRRRMELVRRLVCGRRYRWGITGSLVIMATRTPSKNSKATAATSASKAKAGGSG